MTINSTYYISNCTSFLQRDYFQHICFWYSSINKTFGVTTSLQFETGPCMHHLQNMEDNFTSITEINSIGGLLAEDHSGVANSFPAPIDQDPSGWSGPAASKWYYINSSKTKSSGISSRKDHDIESKAFKIPSLRRICGIFFLWRHLAICCTNKKKAISWMLLPCTNTLRFIETKCFKKGASRLATIFDSSLAKLWIRLTSDSPSRARHQISLAGAWWSCVQKFRLQDMTALYHMKGQKHVPQQAR